jgi:hypothetical protein
MKNLPCAPTIVHTDHNGNVRLQAGDCGKWSCPIHRPKKRRRLLKRFRHGAPTRWFTLTSNPRLYESPAQARRVMGANIPNLVKRIRRFSKRGLFEYGLVWENTKHGWPHCHVLYRGPYIRKQRLSDWWNDLTGAPIVDIGSLTDTEHAARYVSKYASKGLAEYPGQHSFQFSENFELEKEPRTPWERGEWRFLGLSHWRLTTEAASLARAGYLLAMQSPRIINARPPPDVERSLLTLGGNPQHTQTLQIPNVFRSARLA